MAFDKLIRDMAADEVDAVMQAMLRPDLDHGVVLTGKQTEAIRQVCVQSWLCGFETCAAMLKDKVKA